MLSARKTIPVGLCVLGLLATACRVATSSPDMLGRNTPISGVSTSSSHPPSVTPEVPTSTPALEATRPSSPTHTSTTTPTITPTPTPEWVTFAVIGDYGSGNENEARVASLVQGWDPDVVLTVGDNNYPLGEAETIDDHIGRFYHTFIYPYVGVFGPGAAENHFFPSLGNHDLHTEGGQPYYSYFTLPGNERYYDFTWGMVQFFCLNSMDSEPDGVGRSSAQAAWLRERMTASTSAWQVVYFHLAPYSSGYHGSIDWMRWPFADWGADVVLSGHDHTYERLEVAGIPYVVNGLGGGAIYSFMDPLPESRVRFNAAYGALLGAASEQRMIFQFITDAGEVVDTFELER